MRKRFWGASAILLATAGVCLAGPVPDRGVARSPAGTLHRVADTIPEATKAALDERFVALKAAADEAAADAITREIWTLWRKSGDGQIDEMMSDAIRASGFGQKDRAQALLDEIIKRRPDFAEAWNQRATMRFFEGRNADALADCLEVLKREPRHFGALAGMGLIALSEENFRGSLAALRRAHALHPFLKERHLIPVLEKKLAGVPL